MAADYMQYLKSKFMDDYLEAVEEFGKVLPLQLHFNEILQVLRDNIIITNSTPMVMKDWLFYLKISLADCVLIAEEETKLKTQKKKKIQIRANQVKNLWFMIKTGTKLIRIRKKLMQEYVNALASRRRHTMNDLQRSPPRQFFVTPCGYRRPCGYERHLPPFDETQIYGVNDKVKQIQHKLFLLPQHDHDDATINTIGIVGMGGSGKSVVAKMVFLNLRVQKNYSHMIWVEFSNDAKLKHIYFEEETMREIETSFSGDLDDLEKLLQNLYRYLVGRKYLIVLDNVTDKCVWYYDDLDSNNNKGHNIKQSHGFPRGNGGAIIVTTVSEDFAMKMVGGHYPNLYRVLPDLDGESCWSIFKDSMCMDLEFEDEEMLLLEMKDEIVQECGGLPLAAKTLAQIIPLQIFQQRPYVIILLSIS